MKFLLLHYADESAEWSAEETREDRTLLTSWLEDTIARGVNLQGSYLQPSRNAATIRARDGELLLTDGPFAETKEQIAGFDIIECADMREAIEVASAHPTTRHGTIEIRPFPPDLPAAPPSPSPTPAPPRTQWLWRSTAWDLANTALFGRTPRSLILKLLVRRAD